MQLDRGNRPRSVARVGRALCAVFGVLGLFGVFGVFGTVASTKAGADPTGPTTTTVVPVTTTTTVPPPTTAVPTTTTTAPPPTTTATSRPPRTTTTSSATTSSTTTTTAPLATAASSKTPWGLITLIVVLVIAIVGVVVLLRRRKKKLLESEWRRAVVPALSDAQLARDSLLSGNAMSDDPELRGAVTVQAERAAGALDRAASSAPDPQAGSQATSAAAALRGLAFAIEADRLLRQGSSAPTGTQLAEADEARRARTSELGAALVRLSTRVGSGPHGTGAA
jgi:hypothetical protein